MNNALRGRIVELYKTLTRFAEALGWSYRKTSYIVSGKQEATAKEIEAMADALQVEVPDDFRALFLH